MVFAYDGPGAPPALRRRIARGEAAGVIVFARNVPTKARLRAELRSLEAIARPRGLRAPLLVLVDQEGGPVRRLPGAPVRAAAQTTTAAAARASGRGSAANLRSVGANVVLAPVADVGRSGAALVGERRVYPGDAQTVGRLARAFAAGARSQGVVPTLKHFPGFGAARVNTDFAPARIAFGLSTLRAVDLRPYRDLPSSHAVMLSTAVYPRVSGLPAAFSRRWATTELRSSLGFRGVSMTDDLQTPTAARYGGPGRTAFLAVRAGVDLPLFGGTYAAGARAAESLVRDARAGRLRRSQVEAPARRVLRLRARLDT